MIYRNNKEDSRAKLNVEIKNNLFEFTPEAASGLVTCDYFLFERNICTGFKATKNSALFYCGNDNNRGSYIIKNNTLDMISGAVSIIKNPKYHEVAKNKVTTSSTPAFVFVQGDNMEEAVFNIHDNDVNGASAMALLLATPKELNMLNNKSKTISEAVTLGSTALEVRGIFKKNKFEKESEQEK